MARCVVSSTKPISTISVSSSSRSAIGLGNGAVFKLVPEYFPTTVGSVTGLVGASGGLGGFFPPLVVGTLFRLTGTYRWGFVLLSLFAVFCFVVTVMSRRRAIASDATGTADVWAESR